MIWYDIIWYDMIWYIYIPGVQKQPIYIYYIGCFWTPGIYQTTQTRSYNEGPTKNLQTHKIIIPNPSFRGWIPMFHDWNPWKIHLFSSMKCPISIGKIPAHCEANCYARVPTWTRTSAWLRNCKAQAQPLGLEHEGFRIHRSIIYVEHSYSMGISGS